MSKEQSKSIITSYVLGAPIGIFVLFFISLISFFTYGSVIPVLAIAVNVFSMTGLIISFLIALWVGGKLAYAYINMGKSLLFTSFRYSIIVNVIIGAVFCLVIGLTVEKQDQGMLIIPVIALVLCTIITTFSLGLLIAYVIKRINIKPAITTQI